MTVPKYNVILKGEILPQADRSMVLSRMQSRFHIDAQKAEQLLRDSPKVIKKNIDRQAAEQYAEALTRIGLVCELEPQEHGDDIDLQMEKETTPEPAAAPALCPKCDHPLDNPDMPECPNCGVIVEKYVALQNAASASAALAQAEEESASPTTQDTMAPWSARFSAGIASLLVVSAMICLVSLIAAAGLYIKYQEYLTQPIPPGAWMVKQQVERIADIHSIVVFITTLIIVFFYFILGPIRKDGTWAQRFAGLHTLSIHTGQKPGILTWPLRTAGSFITALSAFILFALWCGISLIPLFLHGRNHPSMALLEGCLLLLLGLFLLYKLMTRLARKNPRSLADKFSRTRQFRKAFAAKVGLGGGLWAIILIAGLITGQCAKMTLNLLTPPDPVAWQKNIEASRNNVDIGILEKTHQFQTRFFQQNGHYNDDPIFFAAEYCNSKGLRDASYTDAAIKGRLQLEITESGYRAELKIKDHPNRYHVYTEAGYQGVEAYETE